MKTQTKNQIIEFIKKNQQVSPAQLQRSLEITPQALHRHLKRMLFDDIIAKFGTPPHVFYSLKAAATENPRAASVSDEVKVFLEERYLYISPQGQILRGIDGFESWAKNTKQDAKLANLAQEFMKIRNNLDSHFDHKTKLIDATEKFRHTFKEAALDRVYYSDFYSLPKFGKSPLGALLLYAKQAQSIKLMKQIVDLCEQSIDRLIKKERPDAVVWVPHSLPRKIPFLKEMRRMLALSLPEISFVKAYTGEVPVPQKSLAKLEERMENAETTIFPAINKIDFNRILVIDDAVGSGATLNAVAKKLKAMKPKSTIIGYAFVGSFKGFEVIKEV